jgi:RNA polymerase sigma-70 factor (ECF subfamily)
MDATDEELLELIRNGDDEALAVLFDRYVETLRGYAQRWLPDRLRRRVSVADILQEARMGALERCRDFEQKDPGSVRNWLLRIVEHKVKDAMRRHAGAARRAVDREVSSGGRPDTGQIAGHAPSPSQFAIAAELSLLADRAFESLPPDYREVLRLARAERLSPREIAVRMDRSREAVNKLCARALSRFSREFERLKGESHG